MGGRLPELASNHAHGQVGVAPDRCSSVGERDVGGCRLEGACFQILMHDTLNVR